MSNECKDTYLDIEIQLEPEDLDVQFENYDPRIGSMADLKTNDRTSVVAAINDCVDSNLSIVPTLNVEITERQNQDIILENLINTVTSNLNAEIERSTAKDSELRDAIDTLDTSTEKVGLLSDLKTDDKTSIVAAVNECVSDNTDLTTKLNAEITNRTNADTALQTNITSVKSTADNLSSVLSVYNNGKGAAFFKEATAEGLQIKGQTVIQSPTTGNTLWNFTEASDASYSVIGLSTPNGDVVQTLKFRNIGNATPELIGWDGAHGCYTFRASYQALYATGCLIVSTNGEKTKEFLGAYYNTNESMLEFQNIGHTAKMLLTMNGSTSGLPQMYVYDGTNATTLAAINKNSAYISPWRGIGDEHHPVYFSSTYGYPVKLSPFNMFTSKSVVLQFTAAANTFTEKGTDVYNLVDGCDAIAICGWYFQVATTSGGTYSSKNNAGVVPTDVWFDFEDGVIYVGVYNTNSSARYIDFHVNVLYAYK